MICSKHDFIFSHLGPQQESLVLKCVLTFALAMWRWLYQHFLKGRDPMKITFSQGKNKPGNKRKTLPAVMFIELVYFHQQHYRKDLSFCSIPANYFPKAKLSKNQRSPHSDTPCSVKADTASCGALSCCFINSSSLSSKEASWSPSCKAVVIPDLLERTLTLECRQGYKS